MNKSTLLKLVKQASNEKYNKKTYSGLDRKSNSYTCTLDLTSETDLDILTKIRILVSDYNFFNPSLKKLTVSTKPTKLFGSNIRDENKNLVGGLDNTKIIDVYIY